MQNSASVQKDALRILPDETLIVHPFFGILITIVLLGLFTWAIEQLMRVTNAPPNGILYLIPVAFSAALLGLRGGYITAVAALMLYWIVFDTHSGSIHYFGKPDEVVKFVTMMLSMFIVASVTGRLHATFRDLRRLNASLIESERRRMGFSREVLHAVTGGRLEFCDDAEFKKLIGDDPCIATVELREARDVAELRHRLRDIIKGFDVPFCRTDDLDVAVTEAASNAVKHGGGGVAEIRVSPQGISLLIVDHGEGISSADLARATLERGFSTTVSLGMGFTIMLECTDMLALSSSPTGTSVLLRRYNAPLPNLGDRLLARYNVPAIV